MTDVAFVIREDELLAKKASAMRELKLRRLEFQALYETCRDECQMPVCAHVEHVWDISHGPHCGRLPNGR